MKYFVIFLLLAGFVFSVASAQYQGDVKFYHLTAEADSKQYSILSQSTVNKFNDVFYDDQAGSLIFSISESADLIDSVAITMNQHSFSELFSSGKTQDPNSMLVLINGEEQPYKTVKDNNAVSWVFRIPPISDEVELIPSSERFVVGNYQLEDVPNSLPKTYPPLKQEHIGISINNIQCKENMNLLQKYDGTPACAKQESVEKLLQRGLLRVPVSASFHVEKDCNGADGRAEAQCFKDAFESCTFAKANSVIHTIEGDAMYLESIIKADCQIHTTFDNTGDHFGGSGTGITNNVCNNVELEEKHVWIIDDCTSEQEFQINYMGHDWELDKQCRDINGIWNYTHHNCTDIPNLETCNDNGGSLACMSYEQMGHGRDVCRNVCNFDASTVDRK